ncbi:MAG: hypothetical protein AB7S86_07715 [Hydrogenophaga sp.]|uniref:hypothetical protein n=1 Tax=Hydrogenophaga sp. TaxID=1904254 RepID=UPI003D0A7018
MDPLQLIAALPALPVDMQRDWRIAAAVVVAVIGLVLWLEFRLLNTQGKAGSWLVVRVVSLAAGPLAAMAVIVPARSVSGMEGLAVFYALLFTVAPLVWLGIHLGLGRLLRPALSAGEGVALSLSGLVVLGLPAMAVFSAVEPLEKAARHLQDNPRNPGPPVALAHAVQPVSRFQLAKAGAVFSQSLLAPPGLRLLRVDERVGELWEDMTGRTHPRYCLAGADLHLLWSAREGTPHLRLHWVDADGERRVAEHRPDVGSAQGLHFGATFRPDGFGLAAPVPRTRVHFATHRNAAGEPNYIAMGNAVQEGERHDGCVMPDYRRLRAAQEGPVLAVMIVFQRPGEMPSLEAFAAEGR